MLYLRVAWSDWTLAWPSVDLGFDVVEHLFAPLFFVLALQVSFLTVVLVQKLSIALDEIRIYD